MKRILFIFVAILLFQNCFDTQKLLQPSNKELKTKLLPLVVGSPKTEIVKSEIANTTTTQTYFATIFQREVETNIF